MPIFKTIEITNLLYSEHNYIFGCSSEDTFCTEVHILVLD